jgi:WD40 repeat protein
MTYLPGRGDDQELTDTSPRASEAGSYAAFLSYSRVDLAIAEQLRADLQARRIAVWLDIEGIVGGEQWKARITRAIEACNAFVFLVSGDALRSDACADELDRAVGLRKLVIPVHCRDIDGEELPPVLAGADAVWLRATDPRDEGLDRLADALRLDLAWRVRHTQIAGRAREWADADHDRSALLVGAELRSAEAWLGARGDHSQTPTTAHSEYIMRSRRAANARQRNQMTAALGVLFVAVALAIIAIVARDTTIHSQHITLSRALAAQAASVADQDPGLAAALSLEAQRVAPTSQALDELESVLGQLGEPLGHLQASADVVRSVAISRDGAILASGNANGTLGFSDLPTRAALGPPLAASAIGAVRSVAFSPHGTMLVSGGDDGTVRLWNVTTHREIGLPLRGNRRGVASVAFSPDGRTVASAGEDGTLRLWSVATRAQLGPPLAGTGTSAVLSVAFSSDGRLLATAAADGIVRLWEVATRRPSGTPIRATVGPALAVAFAPGDQTLASGGADGVVRVWDVATHRQSGPAFASSAPGVGVWGITFAPGGRTIAVSGSGAQLWDVATRRALGPALRASTDAKVTYGAVFTPDGRTLVTASTQASLWNVAARGAGGPTVLTFDPPSAGVAAGIANGSVKPVYPIGGDVAFSPDSRTVAIADPAGDLRLWDVATRGLYGAPIVGQGVTSVAFSPDRRTLATGGQDGAVRLWSVATRRQIGPPLGSHPGPVLGIAFSPDGRTVASAGGDGTTRLWSVTHHAEIGAPLPGQPGVPTTGVAFSPDGRLLASVSVEVRLWSVATLRPAGEPLSAPGATLGSVAFSPDGKLLGTGGPDDGTVRLWDAATRRELATLRGHTAGVDRVAFSPDGRFLASASVDDSVRLWNVARRAPIGAPLLPDGPVQGLAFSPDGTTLASVASADASGQVRLWDPLLWSGGLAARQARACSAGRRNLSRVEWSRYVPGQSYHATCPGA